MKDGQSRRRDMQFARIAELLGRAIVRGEYGKGKTLPREADLAVTYAVGRSAVREALKMLAAKGLIESRPRRGTTIREPRSWNMFDPDIQMWLRAGSDDREMLADLMEWQRLVLPVVVELAAMRIRPSDRERLQAARTGLAQAADRQAAMQALLTLILEASGNRYVLATVPAAVTAFTLWSVLAGGETEDVADANLIAVAEAVAAAQPAAARLAMERCFSSPQPSLPATA